jgi:hypothetical protein
VVGFVQVASAPRDLPVGYQKATVEKCPAGMQVVGGGVQTGSPSTQVSVNDTYPTDAGDGWHVDVNNNSNAVTTFTVYAICAKLT